MNDQKKASGDSATGRPNTKSEAELRHAREAEALRANLLRRKQQARARRKGDADTEPGDASANGAAGA